jgi:hypothetical protein
MISIITPAHKVIPWFNARLINICSQDSDEWEWIILDNSVDGCVKAYVDDFFTKMQGIHYPQCREKIKVYHEPQFADIQLIEGKMGKMCNRLVELTNCGYDGFFMRLDFDDFLFDGCIRMLNEAIRMNPDTEFVTGQIGDCLIMTKDGNFDYVDFSDAFSHKPDDLLEIMYSHNICDASLLKKYEQDLEKNGLHRRLVPCACSLAIPYTELFFYQSAVQSLIDGWDMFGGVEHPLCIKKSAFLKKFGSYVVDNSKEDLISLSYITKFDNIVYIDNPCYLRCVVCTQRGKFYYMDSGTIEVCNAGNNTREWTCLMKQLKYNYDILGLDKLIVPKRIKF